MSAQKSLPLRREGVFFEKSQSCCHRFRNCPLVSWKGHCLLLFVCFCPSGKQEKSEEGIWDMGRKYPIAAGRRGQRQGSPRQPRLQTSERSRGPAHTNA